MRFALLRLRLRHGNRCAMTGRCAQQTVGSGSAPRWTTACDACCSGRPAPRVGFWGPLPLPSALPAARHEPDGVPRAPPRGLTEHAPGASALRPGVRRTLDNPTQQHDEQFHQGKHGHEARRHHHWVIGGELFLQRRQPDRERGAGVVGGHDQRPHPDHCGRGLLTRWCRLPGIAMPRRASNVGRCGRGRQ